MMKKTMKMVALATAMSLTVLNLGVIATPVKAAGLKGKIVVWSWTDAKKSLEDSAKMFQKKNPNVKFEFVELSSGDVRTKLATSLQTGKGLPDLVTIEADSIQGMTAKFPKAFADVTKQMSSIKKDFFNFKVSEVKNGSKYIGFPYDAAPSMMFYRTDLFKKAGIDAKNIKTWDDAVKYGKILKQKTGVSLLTNEHTGDDGLYRQMMIQQGSFYLNNSGKVAVNSAESKKAFNKMKEMVKAGVLAQHQGWDDMISKYKSGKVAAAVFGTWFIGTLQSNKIAAGKWGMIPMPAFTASGSRSAVNGGSDLLVPDKAENKAAAIAFAKFASTDTKALVNLFTKYGQLPSYEPVLKNAAFNKTDAFFGNQKIWPAIIESGKTVNPPNYSKNFQEIKKTVVDYQTKMFVKNEDINSSLKALEKDVKDILKNN